MTKWSTGESFSGDNFMISTWYNFLTCSGQLRPHVGRWRLSARRSDNEIRWDTGTCRVSNHDQSRRDFLVHSARMTAGIGVAALLGNLGQWALSYAADKEPIKVGVLHSLSGTMAISEVSLRDVVLMAVDEINAKGGIMGRQVKPVVVDPASNWDLFAEKAKQLLLQDKVAVVFGCWTSVSRKSVLPVFEKNNGLLFYPVQYEGEECSCTTCSTPGRPSISRRCRRSST